MMKIKRNVTMGRGRGDEDWSRLCGRVMNGVQSGDVGDMRGEGVEREGEGGGRGR